MIFFARSVIVYAHVSYETENTISGNLQSEYFVVSRRGSHVLLLCTAATRNLINNNIHCSLLRAYCFNKARAAYCIKFQF